MRAFFLLLAILVATAIWAPQNFAQAQTVQVNSGDHDGFTRLVLQAPGLSGWRLFRLDTGYQVTLRRQASFDLSRAFDVIGRQRLAALTPTSDGRGLTLTVACTCHAIGFDYRPGVVVIDLRDGPPPDGSSFELALDGTEKAPLQKAHEVPAPERRITPTELNWTAWTNTPPSQQVALPPLSEDQATTLRALLLQDFAEGAARGLISPVDHLPATQTNTAEAESTRSSLVALPRLIGATPNQPTPAIAADGTACIADERLALPDWGNPDQPGYTQLADIAAMLGEFDRPDPNAVERAVQRTLWLGFGAEAAALVNAFASDAPEAVLWRSMSRVVDGVPDPDGAFKGMLACDGSVALWAALSVTRFSSADVDDAAVIRAFSALPPHLRRHLGPSLSDRFLQSGDTSPATAIRDAIVRADSKGTPLIDAHLALADGDPDGAAEAISEKISSGGPELAPALITLVDARVQARRPLTPAETEAVAALSAEHGDDPALTRAAILAAALAGDWPSAFAALQNADSHLIGRTSSDLWALLAEMGSDSALLTHAVLADDVDPVAPITTRVRIAKRLTDFGFGTEAQKWLGSDGDPLALATADLAKGDARAALTRIAGRPGKEAEVLRAKALLALGDAEGAATLWSSNGNAEAELAARILARDWAQVQNSGPEAWRSAAETLSPTPKGQGQLAGGRAFLEASAKTRTAIAALLETMLTSEDAVASTVR